MPNHKQKKLDTLLMKLSNEQMMYFTKYRKAGNMVAQQIFGILKSHARDESISISRCVIGGSIGKRSSLGVAYEPDFDLVVFLNRKEPPFEDVIEKLEIILSENCHQRGLKYWLKKSTRHCLKFKVETRDGACFSFDLLPAANLFPPGHGGLLMSKASREQLQTENALIKVSELDDPDSDSSLYSSSLVDRCVSFTRRQCPFTHNLIRLAKLWNKGISYFESNYLYGRSTMIELVAIFAADEEKKEAQRTRARPSISVAFQAFLEMFIDFDENMSVSFPFKINPNQKELFEVYVGQIENCPVILDPVNPYNNLATALSDDDKRAFEEAAERTLASLKRGNDNGVIDGVGIVGASSHLKLIQGLMSLKINGS